MVSIVAVSPVVVKYASFFLVFVGLRVLHVLFFRLVLPSLYTDAPSNDFTIYINERDLACSNKINRCHRA